MIAAGIAMLVLSTLVAFHGWPHVTDQTRAADRSVAVPHLEPPRDRVAQRVVLGGKPQAAPARKQAKPKRASTPAAPRLIPVTPPGAVKPAGGVLGESETGGPDPVPATTVAPQPVVTALPDLGPVEEAVSEAIAPIKKLTDSLDLQTP